MAKPTGYIVYRGPSELNRKPIVAVVTLKSNNDKTGDMPQLWILPEPTVYGMPTDASKTCNDDSVCGDCPLRRSKGGCCYVTLHQAPRAVASGVVRGIYPEASPDVWAMLAQSNIRRGAYGDPAALPDIVWEWLQTASGTGYTHQWETASNRLRSQVMASVDSQVEYNQATANGWRTFRTMGPGQPLLDGEIMCPSDKVSCSRCGLCNGSKGANDKRKNIAIVVHGPLAVRFSG